MLICLAHHRHRRHLAMWLLVRLGVAQEKTQLQPASVAVCQRRLFRFCHLSYAKAFEACIRISRRPKYIFNVRHTGLVRRLTKIPLAAESNLNRRRKQNLHSWVRVNQAIRPLSPKTLNILVGLSLKLISLCNHN